MATYGTIPIIKGANTLILFPPVTVTNITGWTLVFSIRKNLGDPATVLQLTATLTANGQVTITSATNGNISVNITATGTTLLIGGQTYFWDLWRTDSGFEDELASGQMTVSGSARVGN